VFGRLPTLTSQTLEVAGLPVHFAEAGSGPPVVLLHGWGGSIASFGSIPAILAERCHVIALDLPGFGQTPVPDRAWGARDFATLVGDFIHRRDLGPVVLVGHSHGGRAAIALAAREPRLIRKLVLVDSAGIVPPRTARYYLCVFGFKALRRVVTLPVLKQWESRILAWAYRALGSGDYQTAGDPVRRATLVKVVNEDLRQLLPLIQAPTLLVWGSEDKDTPLADGKLMERLIPDAGLVVFEGAGHFSYLDELDRFCRIVTYFVEQA
jgi:pimeloyl-ACP methyl ester carboxylesterase